MLKASLAPPPLKLVWQKHKVVLVLTKTNEVNPGESSSSNLWTGGWVAFTARRPSNPYPPYSLQFHNMNFTRALLWTGPATASLLLGFTWLEQGMAKASPCRNRSPPQGELFKADSHSCGRTTHSHLATFCPAPLTGALQTNERSTASFSLWH